MECIEDIGDVRRKLHDLNNVLGVVRNWAELLEMRATDDRTQRAAQALLEAAAEGARLVQDLRAEVVGANTPASTEANSPIPT